MNPRLAILLAVMAAAVAPDALRADAVATVRPAACEFVVAGHRALMHREAQPDFDYDSVEVRWLRASRTAVQWLLGVGAGKPRGEFGSYVAMGFGGLRYYFDHSPSVDVYLQVDSGVFVTDANRVHSQRLIGNTLEFRSQGALGAGWRPAWLHGRTMFAEVDYEHISNAGLARRNLGADDFGLAFGLRW